MNKIKLSAGALVVAFVLFFAVNILSNASLRSARIDATEDNLYTLSEGSINIARSLDAPVRLELFFSESQATSAPAFLAYGKRVREMLEEYELRSGGNVQVSVVDPEPFSDEEDRAVQAGLAGLPVNAAGDLLYCGLVGHNEIDGEEVIPFFDPRKERFLEYDVTRVVYTLANPDKKTVGVMSSLPLEGGPPNPMDPRGGAQPPWQILAQLRSFFEVETIPTNATEIPETVDVLFVAHPKGLSDETLYAIDQFVLGGGRMLALVDPHCEADRPPTDPNNPMAAMQADRSSNLDKLLNAWGVTVEPAMIAGDRRNALAVTMGGNQPRAVSFVTYLGLGQDEFDVEAPIISELTQINMAFAGILSQSPDATTDFAPLISTSNDSMRIEQSRVQFMPNPEELLTSFVPEGEALVLAARVSGALSSAFPDGSPAASDAPEGEDGETAAEDANHLATSKEPANVVIVADADMIEDRFWIGEERLGPILLGYRKTADNGDFLINALDNLCGSNDLISVRAGARYSRPFDLVEEIQRNAEERYLAESQELEERLRDTEAKISELQREKSTDDAMLLSADQIAEIDRFREEQIETRKKLRDVKHNLRKDIESLGARLKFANILGTPFLFVALALGYWLTRQRGKRN